jgi:hypothetical protein
MTTTFPARTRNLALGAWAAVRLRRTALDLRLGSQMAAAAKRVMLLPEQRLILSSRPAPRSVLRRLEPE